MLKRSAHESEAADTAVLFIDEIKACISADACQMSNASGGT